MVCFCCIVHCNSHPKKEKLSFYRIPSIISVNNRKYRCTYTTQTYRAHDFIKKNADDLIQLSIKRQKAWENVIKRGSLTKSQLACYRVCSKHFISGHPADLLDESNPDWIPSIDLDPKIDVSLNDISDLDKSNKCMQKSKPRRPRLKANETISESPQKPPKKRFVETEYIEPKKQREDGSEEEDTKNFILKQEDEFDDKASFSSIDDISNVISNLFDNIYEDDKSIEIPVSWHRIPISWDYRRGVTFLKVIGKKGPNNRIDSVCQKEIIIDEEMSFIVKINGKIIHHKHLGIEGDVLVSIKSLENVIMHLENL